jgi:hypothetical protein
VDDLTPMLVAEREAGRLLGVCPKTVFNLRKAGELTAVKIGTRTLYDVSDLKAFIARQKSAAVTQGLELAVESPVKLGGSEVGGAESGAHGIDLGSPDATGGPTT